MRAKSVRDNSTATAPGSPEGVSDASFLNRNAVFASGHDPGERDLRGRTMLLPRVCAYLLHDNEVLLEAFDCAGQKAAPRRVQAYAASRLSHPGARREVIPAAANGRELLGAKGSGSKHIGILLPALGFSRADDGGMHTRHAQREA